MINRVNLVGRMTKDAELRYTQSGTAVASFTVAVNRTFKNQNGEQEADFLNVVVWRKQAENVANFVGKGSLVGIDGRIQSRTYENDNGRQYVTEVVAEQVSFLEPKNRNEGNNTQSQNKQHTGDSGNNDGVSNANRGDSFENSGDTVDISDDDLPF